MSHRPLLHAIVCVALALSACTNRSADDPPIPDLLIASGWLTRIEFTTGRVVAQRFLRSVATDLELSPARDMVGISMQTGGALAHLPELDIVWSANLGIVDAMTFDGTGARAYFLIHPGDDPAEAETNHVLLEIDVQSGEETRRFTLDRRSFDVTRSGDGSHLLVTDLIGRDLHRIDLETGSIDVISVSTGAPRAEEPEQSMLRLALPVGDRDWFVPEDRRGELALWRLDNDAATRIGFDNPVRTPILGGTTDANGIWFHGLAHLVWLAPDWSPREVFELAKSDDEARYRYSSFDGSLAVLVGPRPSDTPGPPQAWVQLWDLESGMRISRRLIEAHAGPVVMMPAAMQ